MHRALSSLAVAFCLLAPAAAQETVPPATSRPGTSVDMPFLIAPLSKDGNLLGYAYISSKLVAASPSAAIAVRDKLAFIQDLNVRDVNVNSVAKVDDPVTVDAAALCLRLAANARRIAGDGNVVRVVITALQFAPLHPDGTTLAMMSTKPADAAQLAGTNQTGAAPVPAAATSEPAKPATP